MKPGGTKRPPVTSTMEYSKMRNHAASILALALLASTAACTPSAPEKPPLSIVITGNDKLKFDVKTFEVKAGQKVVVTLKDIGTMPKATMGHDFVLLNKNTEIAKLLEAGTTHPDTDYIPPDQSFHVLAKTKIVGPRETTTVTFTAPQVPGPYDYICTFPGHYASGMKGVMTVVH